LPASNALWIGGLAFALAVLLDPIRTRLQALADRTFFRGERALTETVKRLTDDLTGALSMNAIGRVIQQTAASALAPSAVHVFVHDEPNGQFTALEDEDNRPSTDIRFHAQGPLAKYLAEERDPVFLDEGSAIPDLQADQSRLALLGAQLLLPLHGHGGPVGWLVLGPRASGEPYAARDMLLLQNMVGESSAAIQRVQTVASLERRLQEMNALSRVSQGVNITLTFDDVLELIYAQTAQMVALTHFHITLFSEGQKYFFVAFALEHNERLSDHENSPIPADVGLAPEVIRRGRPIITQDYAGECQALGVAPSLEGVSAWMGVPLNAGAESIGSLSVANSDPGIVYTRGQLDLLQAVADQTAGAIVKARRRASLPPPGKWKRCDSRSRMAR
jgi:GAF domain-containing protein